jgi:hypothetical protein
MGIAALLLFIRALGLTLPLWIVAGWSATETAIFFLVADIPISWIAVRSGTRAAMLASVVAAVASIAGTLVVLLWARSDPAGVAHVYASLPGIDRAMIAEAADLYRQGPLAVLSGAFSGIPFKLFALEASKSGGIGFLLLAPLLRLPRFLAVALFSGGVSNLLSKWASRRARLILLVLLWTVFYAFYFSVMPR